MISVAALANEEHLVYVLEHLASFLEEVVVSHGPKRIQILKNVCVGFIHESVCAFPTRFALDV